MGLFGVTTGAEKIWEKPRLGCTAWRHKINRQATPQNRGKYDACSGILCLGDSIA